MIILGFQGVTYSRGKGEFCCPRCGPGKLYENKRVRRFFTLFFIPLIPLDHLADYVECQHCSGTYHPEVLEFDPEKHEAELRAEYEKGVLRVMVGIMLADGEVDSEEISTIQDIQGRLTGRKLGEAEILEEISHVEAETETIPAQIGKFGPMLNEQGKEIVLKAAIMVAAADGVFHEDEKTLIEQVAQALGMTEAHLRGVLEVTSDKSSEI